MMKKYVTLLLAVLLTIGMLTGCTRGAVIDEYEAVDHLRFVPDSSVYMFYGTDSLTLAFKVREKVLEKAKEAAE